MEADRSTEVDRSPGGLQGPQWRGPELGPRTEVPNPNKWIVWYLTLG